MTRHRWMDANRPRPYHVVGAILHGASWLTLLGLVLLTLAHIDAPGGTDADWLIGIPAAFRLVGNAVYGIRGTWMAWPAAIIDGLLIGAIASSVGGNAKSQLLAVALIASSFVPAWWCGTGGRLGAAFGITGTGFAVTVWFMIEARSAKEMLLPLLGATVILIGASHAAVAYWALMEWRARQVRADDEPGAMV